MNIKLFVGAKLKLVPFAPNNFAAKSANSTRKSALPCTVVYINFPHRWFSARFDFKYGSFTEAFKFTLPEDQPDNLCTGRPRMKYGK